MSEYKTLVVTGASSGIGAAIAKKFCMNGSTVYALSRNTRKLNMVRKELPAKVQSKFIVRKCDVTNNAEVDKVFKKIFQEKNVDMVVSNAGLGYSKPFIEYSEKEMQEVIETNLFGALGITRSCLKYRKNKRLQIVYTSSLAGKIGFPNLSIYSASKFALEGLAESLRGEYSNEDVTFTILRPGITRTAFFKKAGMQEFENSVKNLRSYYSPEKVADIFYDKIKPSVHTIVVGTDKVFLKLLPFTPFKHRLHILGITNRL